MANVFEQIDYRILECIDAETGEVVDVEKLEQLEMERDLKIANIAMWIKNLRADAEMYKKQKLIYEKEQSIAKNKADSLERFLSNYVVDKWDKDPLKRVKITFRKSKAVDVYDLDALMNSDYADEFLRYKEPEPRKDDIKQALLSGKVIAGCSLVENNNMQIR